METHFAHKKVARFRAVVWERDPDVRRESSLLTGGAYPHTSPASELSRIDPPARLGRGWPRTLSVALPGGAASRPPSARYADFWARRRAESGFRRRVWAGAESGSQGSRQRRRRPSGRSRGQRERNGGEGQRQ